MGEAKEGGYSPHEAQQAYSAEEIASFKEGRLSELATCRAHSSSVRSVVFSPGGKTIISGSYDMTIKVWDAASLELKAEKESAHSRNINSVAFSPDGKTIVSGSDDKTIKVWDAGVSALTHPQTLELKSDYICACCSIPGAQGGETERAQQLRALRGLLARR